MKQIDIKNLEINDHIDFGSFSNVYSVTLDGRKYCYKKFKNPKLFGREFYNKISELSELTLLYSVMPKYLVKDNEQIGYLSELYNHKDLGYAYSYNLKDKIMCLKMARNALKEIHELGIVHCDIHFGNFLLRSSKLIDFDNCHYKTFNCNYDLLSCDATRFIKKYGISSDLDVYLFNKMTFLLLNDKMNDNNLDSDIHFKKYGIFESRESKEICNALLLEENSYNNNFLIDTVNIKKYEKKLD